MTRRPDEMLIAQRKDATAAKSLFRMIVVALKDKGEKEQTHVL